MAKRTRKISAEQVSSLVNKLRDLKNYLDINKGYAPSTYWVKVNLYTSLKYAMIELGYLKELSRSHYFMSLSNIEPFHARLILEKAKARKGEKIKSEKIEVVKSDKPTKVLDKKREDKKEVLPTKTKTKVSLFWGLINFEKG